MYDGFAIELRRIALERSLEHNRNVGKNAEGVVEDAQTFFDFIAGDKGDTKVPQSEVEDDTLDDTEDTDWIGDPEVYGPFRIDLNDPSELPQKLQDVFKLIQAEHQFREQTGDFEDVEGPADGPSFTVTDPEKIHTGPIAAAPLLPPFLQRMLENVADAMEKRLAEQERQKEEGQQ